MSLLPPAVRRAYYCSPGGSELPVPGFSEFTTWAESIPTELLVDILQKSVFLHPLRQYVDFDKAIPQKNVFVVHEVPSISHPAELRITHSRNFESCWEGDLSLNDRRVHGDVWHARGPFYNNLFCTSTGDRLSPRELSEPPHPFGSAQYVQHPQFYHVSNPAWKRDFGNMCNGSVVNVVGGSSSCVLWWDIDKSDPGFDEIERRLLETRMRYLYPFLEHNVYQDPLFLFPHGHERYISRHMLILRNGLVLFVFKVRVDYQHDPRN